MLGSVVDEVFPKWKSKSRKLTLPHSLTKLSGQLLALAAAFTKQTEDGT